MSEHDSPTRPLLLFDGVCNLCSAAVQWVIERDPDGRIHFASLQSNAARRALEDAGAPDDLPDSMVLIDARGVHTQSTAAIRVARAVGLPYSLLMLLLIVPRPIRDFVYRLIARRRYRWFGKRNSCMVPTPELRARFTDADDPPDPDAVNVASYSAIETDERTRLGGFLRGFLIRVAIVYVIAYMLPFPVSLLSYVYRVPGVMDLATHARILSGVDGIDHEWMFDAVALQLDAFDQALNAHSDVTGAVVPWVGNALFNVEIDRQFNGSGDRAFHYVDGLVDAVFALIIAMAWSAFWWFKRNGRALPYFIFDGSRILARYYLGTTLLSYGWVKAFPLQFLETGPDRLLQPYGDSSPMGLLWTFMGHNPVYQMFTGVAELIGGYLLFFRRTTLLGALICAGVMTNVAAMNYLFDVPVKLFSSHLVLVAVFLIIPELPRLLSFFFLNVPTIPGRLRPFWADIRSLVCLLLIAKLAFVGGLTWDHISQNRTMMEQRVAYARHPLYGVYQVEHFERAGLTDRENEDADRWVRVGIHPMGYATIMHANGIAERMRMVLAEEVQSIDIFDRGVLASPDGPMHYTRPEDGVLRIEGVFQGEAMTVTLRKQETDSLLNSRGFNWINEYPFNR